jgi:hypothetical protein
MAPAASLGLDPDAKYLAFDFWSERFLGIVQGEIPFEALHDGACQAISFRPLLDRPQVLGTNRHLGQGAYELEDVRWSGHALSGRFRRGPGRKWSVFVHIPAGWQVDGVEGADVRYDQEGRVAILTFAEGSDPAAWRMSFRHS